MAAQVLARSLGLDLYRVDLAGVVSKYIGETEKHLREVFEACERAPVLLLFDEADALFGKRTQVSDAHDRYANIEIDYVLQRMEQFDGVAVLATNRKGDLDTAFVRRLRFIVDFAPPSPAERERLWRLALEGARDADGRPLTGELDWAGLARELDLTGAGIKSAALAAAFLARSDGGARSGSATSWRRPGASWRSRASWCGQARWSCDEPEASGRRTRRAEPAVHIDRLGLRVTGLDEAAARDARPAGGRGPGAPTCSGGGERRTGHAADRGDGQRRRSGRPELLARRITERARPGPGPRARLRRLSRGGAPVSGFVLKGALVEFMPTFLPVPVPNVIVFQYNPETMTHTWTQPEPATASRDRDRATRWRSRGCRVRRSRSRSRWTPGTRSPTGARQRRRSPSRAGSTAGSPRWRCCSTRRRTGGGRR